MALAAMQRAQCKDGNLARVASMGFPPLSLPHSSFLLQLPTALEGPAHMQQASPATALPYPGTYSTPLDTHLGSSDSEDKYCAVGKT